MIPEEVLIDIFKWLDRMNIDMLQLVSTSFCHVIDENISDVCLRWIPAMTVRSARNSPYRLDIYEDPSYATSIRIEATNAICIVDHLHARLRHASVGSLECANLPLELFQWFTQFPLPGVVHTLSVPGTYTFRTDHVLLHRFVLCFGSLRSAAFVADTFSKTLISGDFLRECASHEIMSVELDNVYQRPVTVRNDDYFDVTEDDITEFLFGHPAVARPRRLILQKVRFGSGFFKRLVE
ncbi:hypothetical protein AAVH_42356, partial [Aphelenchoides avenae]